MDVGVIYILTNPSFPEYVKIGVTDDINQTLSRMNNSGCVPVPFELYATYTLDRDMSEGTLYSIVARLCSDFVETGESVASNGFYAMPTECALEVLRTIALINGREGCLVLADTSMPEGNRGVVQAVERLANFSFGLVQIKPGDFVEFFWKDSKHNGEKFKVLDDTHVTFRGDAVTLSALARVLLADESEKFGNYQRQGPCYFRYNGEVLHDMRKRLGR